jgi:toxin ParE1/3/4
MSRQIIRHEQAKQDIIEAAYYIAEHGSLDASDRFLEAAEDTFRQLATMPGMGLMREVRNPVLAGMRQWRVRGFEKYLIFYRVTEKAVEILRVLHGARDLDSLFDEEPGPP